MKKFARFERDVVAYNEAAEAVMRRRGVPVIDLHGFTKRLGPDIFDDHVHFTPEVRKKQARCLADGLPVRPRT
ncbi:MAG: hypothetical protein EOM10_15280 [Opitutae bacterium]|nr:hypothetical protein [Opitutae bacterium]